MEQLVESHIRFDLATEKAEMLKYLDQYGYAVVKSVATEQEVKTGLGFLWDFMENLPGIEEAWGTVFLLLTVNPGLRLTSLIHTFVCTHVF